MLSGPHILNVTMADEVYVAVVIAGPVMQDLYIVAQGI